MRFSCAFCLNFPNLVKLSPISLMDFTLMSFDIPENLNFIFQQLQATCLYIFSGLVRYEKLLSMFKGRLMVRRLNTAALTHKYIIKYFMTTRSQNRFVVDIPKADIEEFLKLVGYSFRRLICQPNRWGLSIFFSCFYRFRSTI